MATKQFSLHLEGFGQCVLVPGDTVFHGRVKYLTWTLYQSQGWKPLVSFEAHSRSTRAALLRELHWACKEKCLAFIQ